MHVGISLECWESALTWVVFVDRAIGGAWLGARAWEEDRFGEMPQPISIFILINSFFSSFLLPFTLKLV